MKIEITHQKHRPLIQFPAEECFSIKPISQCSWTRCRCTRPLGSIGRSQLTNWQWNWFSLDIKSAEFPSRSDLLRTSMSDSTATATLPLYLTPQFFKRCLEHGLQRQDLKVLDVQLTDLTRGGENYCSNIYRAAIKYQSGNQLIECSLIVKCMPAEKQAILARLHIYNKETLFYTHIKPKLEALMWRASESKDPWTLGAR